ncbi:MAG: hydroxymethylglutaryl-CoA reductase, degradative [Saprospiraceae bacterium]|nr:hydroxymethylglutaryl-CoA reductase, degradative [Saprospiraceae bacterium]
MGNKTISGFSKLSKEEKINWIAERFSANPTELKEVLTTFWQEDQQLQQVLDGFSENTITNYPMPFGIAPNFVIDGTHYAIPMVIEESSVVAAASSAAKFWLSRGGFRTEVRSTVKLGQVHFSWSGDVKKLQAMFPELEQQLRAETAHLTANMEKRGGGISKIELLDLTDREPNYYQLKVSFETCDSMGANFINSVLETFGTTLKQFVATQDAFHESEKELEVIMAILSNFTPDCIVRAWVECPIDQLQGACKDMSGEEFAEKFRKAIRIAEIDPYRATTHNKGIFNGIDAVILATANDFRAVEACGHTYASKDGQYASLSHCTVENGVFKFWIDLPLAVGTVGGLTKLHPLAKLSLEILGQPSAEQLMSIVAATGLAQNFGAVRSLITTGIQKGHMKMHLKNILNHLEANVKEQQAAERYFEKEVVSFSSVRAFLSSIRSQNGVYVHE